MPILERMSNNMLKLENVFVNYANIQVLHGINIEVKAGEIVTIIGANGAGKSTTLKAISGLIPKTLNSSIKFLDEDITSLQAEKVVERGISLSPEGRRIFPDLTVTENLEMGAYLRAKDKEGVKNDMKEVFTMFPRLEERKKQSGKTLSGGEQQMLAIARALMAKPKLLMLDEPSTGLAPLIVKDIFEIIKQVNKKGTTVLLVEQNAKIALSVADRGYVLKNGNIVMEDTGKNLLKNELIRAAYLGESTYKEKKA
ncbi:amino acid/amide ABC transporter ATP-binding protein 2, HAAT family [Flexilinea flocculi]|jgi:branched-chain amino acid transport system ATP-binding protein|uniref:Amino acid/amide ABC transporter ATP-binding protein 2, HAAT family n=2 Tax=Flexilinea flocculi TaxID=1678840 RepID=A0A0K8PB15_9CHLR|nr:amino acid/amide ABC transporter ATP-binding protein 2, HAAT family [Flexilinea flocculi]